MSDGGNCPFCGHDPYHYVDIGVGFQAVAVNCCDLGIALFQHGDELVRRVADHIEALEAETAKIRSYAEDVQRMCRDGHPVSAANVATAILRILDTQQAKNEGSK